VNVDIKKLVDLGGKMVEEELPAFRGSFTSCFLEIKGEKKLDVIESSSIVDPV
jgi:hypothetical protein